MQIYDTLTKDHDELKGLLEQLVGASEPPKELIGKIRDALVPHSRAEEAVFYNSLRAFDEAKPKIMHSFREHAEAETLLRSLQVKEKVAGDWKKTALKLKEGIEHHIAEEQGEIFPLARRLLSDEEARMMASAFTKLKEEIKPEGIVKTSLELVANLMPPRFSEHFRSYKATDRAS